MRFLFLGAGAIGTYIGGSLAASGTEVAFVEQPGPAEQIARDGLTVEAVSGTKVVRDVTVYTDAAAALDAVRQLDGTVLACGSMYMLAALFPASGN